MIGIYLGIAFVLIVTMKTPYACQQISRKPANVQHNCHKMNRLITEYGVKEIYYIGDIKR